VPHRIVVIGTCQAIGVANCLRGLLPEAAIETLALSALRTKDQVDAAAASIPRADTVFSQYDDDAPFDSIRRSSLKPKVGDYIRYPKICFRGLQPDLLVKFTPGKKVGSPAGASLHSRLVVACFLHGLPASRAVDLFNAYIYERLGYFTEYANSIAFMTAQDKALGFELAPRVQGWLQDGSFMHTVNHPQVRVLWAIATTLCDKLGVTPASDAAPPSDHLDSSGYWPIYPELARRIGIQGEMIWRSWDKGEELDLPSFVGECYRRYAAADSASMRVPQVTSAIEVLAAELSPS
jgi:hypothetical protein